MDIPFNWELARHPGNWLTVTLMVLIAFAAVDILLKHFGKQETNQ